MNNVAYNIVPFQFDGNIVRVSVADEHDDLWWVLTDVCKVFDIDNSRAVAARLDDDEKDVITSDTLGGPQSMTIINESGLYSVIFESRKPIAKRFKKWVTSEVLPAIRKTGRYQHQPVSSRDDLLAVVDRLVEPIKGRFIEHDRQLGFHENRLEDHEERLVEVEGKILRFPGRHRRRDISPIDQNRLCSAVAMLGCRCPCCQMVKIVDESCALLRDDRGRPLAEFDHQYDVGKPTIDHVWLICKDCHHKLTYPPDSPRWPRPSVESRFRAFQDLAAPVIQQLRRQYDFGFPGKRK